MRLLPLNTYTAAACVCVDLASEMVSEQEQVQEKEMELEQDVAEDIDYQNLQDLLESTKWQLQDLQDPTKVFFPLEQMDLQPVPTDSSKSILHMPSALLVSSSYSNISAPSSAKQRRLRNSHILLHWQHQQQLSSALVSLEEAQTLFYMGSTYQLQLCQSHTCFFDGERIGALPETELEQRCAEACFFNGIMFCEVDEMLHLMTLLQPTNIAERKRMYCSSQPPPPPLPLAAADP